MRLTDCQEKSPRDPLAGDGYFTWEAGGLVSHGDQAGAAPVSGWESPEACRPSDERSEEGLPLSHPWPPRRLDHNLGLDKHLARLNTRNPHVARDTDLNIRRARRLCIRQRTFAQNSL